MFPGEVMRLSRRWAEKRFADLRHHNEPPKGGHFAATENPLALVADVRATFAKIGEFQVHRILTRGYQRGQEYVRILA